MDPIDVAKIGVSLENFMSSAEWFIWGGQVNFITFKQVQKIVPSKV